MHNNTEFFESIIRNTFEKINVLAPDGVITYSSPFIGHIGKSGYEDIHPDDIPAVMESFDKVLKNPENQIKIVVRTIQESGDSLWTELRMTNLLSDPAVKGIVFNYYDISEYRIVQDELRKFYLAVEEAMEHIIITNTKGEIIYANKAAEVTTGYSRDEILGKTPALWGRQMEPEFYKTLWETIRDKKDKFTGEIRNKRKSGEIYYAEIKIAPILNDENEIIYYVGLEKDISKAKEIDRMKTEFIALASHQLRTPLTAIKWLVENLLGGEVGGLSDDQTKYLNNIYASNGRMIELINDLLNISRIEAGRLVLVPTPTNIPDLVNDVINELSMKSNKKGQSVSLEIDGKIGEQKIDPKMIRQVYANLLSNAIKYTPPKGTITVKITEDQGNLVSSVSDTGYGIPDKDKPHIFEKFHRADNVIKVETDGTGLGLYLVKSIVESSGGKIWFKSEENKGTTMYFTLPINEVIM